jgi:alanine racemase
MKNINNIKIIRPLWIEIDFKALTYNYCAIRRFVGKDVKIIATVKQSAYGHGLVQVAKRLHKEGVDYFGVGSIEEASLLRQAGLNEPILVLTAVLDKFAHEFMENRVTATVVSLTFAKKLDAAAKKAGKIVPVHVKIDTGMGRLGIYYKQAHQFIQSLAKLKNIKLEGIFTHFPSADCDRAYTLKQTDKFNAFIEELRQEGIDFQYHHCANSAGTMYYPKAHFNMVRPGLILYGMMPMATAPFVLKPVLALKSRVVFSKRIPAGVSVSYGRAHFTKKSTNIVTVAAGYADGYPWAISKAQDDKNPPRVIIRNKFYKVVGRVCMDHIMVDTGNDNIKSGEEVILIGQKGSLQITAQEVANWARTIPYEITSRLSLKTPRIYRG